MITVNGIWAPDNDRRGWLQDLPLDEHGFPRYQDDRQAMLIKHARKHRRFIDGGAHIGLYTVPMARKFREVVAFEPVISNFKCLRMNAGKLDNVTLRERALSARTGFVQMTAKPKSSISWHITESADGVPVYAVPLDTYGWTDVDAIKLDVEGHELEALQGARQTILRCKPVILIEEKHDPDRHASAFLRSIGMTEKWKSKNDILWTWTA